MPPPRRLRVPHEVAALVRGLHPALKRKVRAALQAILDAPHSGKALRNELRGLRSYRVGRFRIIYRLRRDVELVAIGPRDSIYVETYRRIHELRGRYQRGIGGRSGIAGGPLLTQNRWPAGHPPTASQAGSRRSWHSPGRVRCLFVCFSHYV